MNKNGIYKQSTCVKKFNPIAHKIILRKIYTKKYIHHCKLNYNIKDIRLIRPSISAAISILTSVFRSL